MTTLQSTRVQIDIVEPGTAYTRTRFDWTGTCRQITLDGKVNYCSQEAIGENKGTEGIGLCNEFGIHTPLAYDDVAVGEYFPKIGVGFLKKTDERPYEFMRDYPLEPAKNEYERLSDDTVIFTQTADRDGWGWELHKTLSVDEDALIIDYALKNTGEHPFHTEEYSHNFFAINEHTIGPDYQMSFPFSPSLETIKGPLVVEDDNIVPSRIPETFFWANQTDFKQMSDVTWTLTHTPSGHGMAVAEHFPLHLFQIWGMSHVISPELFIKIDIKPGEIQRWKRVYRFF